MSSLLHRFMPPFLLALAALWAGAAQAAAFEIAVSPSRFEISGKSGARLGQSLEIYNLGNSPTAVNLRTLDWRYSEDGNLSYHDELLPGSCRPWVRLERPQLGVPAQGRQAFRFQIDVPADAPRGECRFMIAIEGVEPAVQSVIQSSGASLNLPVMGRIAVAVYVAINGAQPQLELRQIALRGADGKRVPVLAVVNTGDAHGRLGGYLDGRDARGQALTITPEGTPILPGQTRMLALQGKPEEGAAPGADSAAAISEWHYPVKARGTLDWEGGSFRIDAELQ